MKILIVDTYYPKFLADFYRSNPIASRSSAEQKKALLASGFGTSDAYSRNLNSLGVEAEEIIANNAPLQLMWARENGLVAGLLSRLPQSWTTGEMLGPIFDRSHVLVHLLVEQIRRAKPDILYLQDLGAIPPDLLMTLKSYVGLVVGQVASPLLPEKWLKPYDLILTSFPHFVDRIRAIGIASHCFRLGFDETILAKIGQPARRYACTFVGGLTAAHARGTAFLEYVAKSGTVDFFGYGKNILRSDSPIRPRHHGEVWGLDMFRVLAESSITINRHIDVAEDNANNMRLYEATGVGTMLLTDAKKNLGDLFEVGKEVVTYRDESDAVRLIRYYTQHPEERDAIAKAGQARTLREHSYKNRMRELLQILNDARRAA